MTNKVRSLLPDLRWDPRRVEQLAELAAMLGLPPTLHPRLVAYDVGRAVGAGGVWVVDEDGMQPLTLSEVNAIVGAGIGIQTSRANPLEVGAMHLFLEKGVALRVFGSAASVGDVSALSDAKQLRDLLVQPKIRATIDISKLELLEILSIRGTGWTGFDGLPRLRHVVLELPPSAGVPSFSGPIDTLALLGGADLRLSQIVRHPDALRDIYVDRFTTLDLTDIGRYRHLQRLVVVDVSMVANADVVRTLSELEHLEFSRVQSVTPELDPNWFPNTTVLWDDEIYEGPTQGRRAVMADDFAIHEHDDMHEIAFSSWRKLESVCEESGAHVEFNGHIADEFFRSLLSSSPELLPVSSDPEGDNLFWSFTSRASAEQTVAEICRRLLDSAAVRASCGRTQSHPS